MRFCFRASATNAAPLSPKEFPSTEQLKDEATDAEELQGGVLDEHVGEGFGALFGYLESHYQKALADSAIRRLTEFSIELCVNSWPMPIPTSLLTPLSPGEE